MAALFGLQSSPAFSQNRIVEPQRATPASDINGVDLTSGEISVPLPTIAIGDGAASIGVSFYATSQQIKSSADKGVFERPITKFTETPTPTGSRYTTELGGAPETFFGCWYTTSARFPFTQTYCPGRSASLPPTILDSVNELKSPGSFASGGGGSVVFTAGNGTRVTFSPNTGISSTGGNVHQPFTWQAVALAGANGQMETYIYKPVTFTSGSFCTQTNRWQRLGGVANSNGLGLKFEYSSDTIQSSYCTSGDTTADLNNWAQRTRVVAFNKATDDCDVSADKCPNISPSRPSLTFAKTLGAAGAYTMAITDNLNRVTTLSYTSVASVGIRLTGVRRPAAAADNMTIDYDASGRVSRVVNDGVTTSYNYVLSDPVPGIGCCYNYDKLTTTVTLPAGGTRVFVTRLSLTRDDVSGYTTGPRERPISDTDALNRKTSYSYDANGRLTDVAAPEGNVSRYVYDARSNVIEQRTIAKSNTGLADIVTTADFDVVCSFPVKCNRPNWTRDATGAQTDFSYDPTTGQTQSVTAPAGLSGIRPQTRYNYASRQAYFKNAGGSIVASGQTMSLLVGTSTCRTASSCLGTADEVTTAISYGPQADGTANNLWPVSITAGGVGLIATSTFTYDFVGNRLSVDGPLAGTADTTTYTYDEARQLTGQISPDPDGVGALKFPAQQFSYNSDGQPTQVSTGTVTSQGTAAWTSFVEFQRQSTAYDVNGRAIQSVLGGKAATATVIQNFAVTQYSYDLAGRPLCTAVRMDPAQWGAQADACLPQTTGPNGPDRVTRTLYDSADQVTKIQSGVGTADQSDDASFIYTLNGQRETAADANGNVTTYVQDGFDRPYRTRYPSPITSGTSSATDFEQSNYDVYGRLSGWVTRKGDTIGFDYDALGRITSKTVPGGANVYYGYDLLGRPLYARFGSASGQGVTTAYDALGRTESTTTDMDGTSRTLGYQYDIAGRRIRITYPDNSSVTTTYDVLGRAKIIAQAGTPATTLATLAYNPLGLRSSLTRGSAAGGTTYTYDVVSRLIRLAHNPVLVPNDVALTFTYNPAGQITKKTVSNDLYVKPETAVAQNFVTNGLNQHYSDGVSGTSFQYDANGNLRFDTNSGRTLGYDAENRLTSAGSVALRYDPLGRLYETAQGGNITRFLYDGDDLVAEYDGAGTMTRRYVHGPGTDEPLVAYENPSSAAPTKRFLFADHQGSVMALITAAGAALINTFDEYGVHGNANAGRFQYTGQILIPELDLYHYKARVYAPGMGWFLQTDPTGYDDGMNLYNYVGSDPVNGTDPSGEATVIPQINIDIWTQPSNPPGFGTPAPGQGTRGCALGGCSMAAYQAWARNAYFQAQARRDAERRARRSSSNASGTTLAGTVAIGLGATSATLFADDVTVIGVADDPVAIVLGLGALAAVSIDGYQRIQKATANVHANTHNSPRGTEVYNLIHIPTSEVWKIGVTSSSKRYSDVALRANNLAYRTIETYSWRYPALVHENIALTHYWLTHGGNLPRLNKVTR